MALFSLVGVIGFSVSQILYGKAQLFPDGLLTQMGPFAAAVGLVVILLANLTTNVAANLVSPSYDFSQLAPDKISFRMGGIIAALIGLVFMPWKLLATSGGYLFTWLGGYGTLLGAIAGILLVDYYLLRKAELNVADLYRRDGEYEYSAGWNPMAVIAFLVGVLPCLPGYLAVSGVIDKASLPPLLLGLFDFGWFFSLAVAGAVYFVTAKRRLKAAIARRPAGARVSAQTSRPRPSPSEALNPGRGATLNRRPRMDTTTFPRDIPACASTATASGPR